MSKNFELLQRVAKDDFFNLPGEPAPPPQKAPAAIPLKKEPPGHGDHETRSAIVLTGRQGQRT